MLHIGTLVKVPYAGEIHTGLILNANSDVKGCEYYVIDIGRNYSITSPRKRIHDTMRSYP